MNVDYTVFFLKLEDSTWAANTSGQCQHPRACRLRKPLALGAPLSMWSHTFPCNPAATQERIGCLFRSGQWSGRTGKLVTDELVERKKPVEVHQDCRKIPDHFRSIYRIYPNVIKENRRTSTCNRLDLQTPGSQPVILCPKISSITGVTWIGDRYKWVYIRLGQHKLQLVKESAKCITVVDLPRKEFTAVDLPILCLYLSTE